MFQLYRAGQFYWWRKPENPEKTTDLPQVTDKLYHIQFVSSIPHLDGIRTHNVSDDSTDCIWSYKSNYHTITTTTSPKSLSIDFEKTQPTTSLVHHLLTTLSITWIQHEWETVTCYSDTSSYHPQAADFILTYNHHHILFQWGSNCPILRFLCNVVWDNVCYFIFFSFVDKSEN